MVARITISPPVRLGQTTLDVLTLRDLTCADTFQAAREALVGGGSGEIQNRAAALAAGLPFAATRAVPIAVQGAIEAWWSAQWLRAAPALPRPVREPIAGDWFDAWAAAGDRSGELEMQARVYALCADISLDHIGALPPAALAEVKAWYDERAGATATVEEIEEAGGATEDPSTAA